MTIAVGDIVIVQGSGLFPSIEGAPRVRGTVIATADVDNISVLWETGLYSVLAETDVRDKFLAVTAPSDAAALPLRKAVRVKGGVAQEMIGVLTDVVIGTDDAGDPVEVIATVVLTGRGAGGSSQYLTVNLGAPTTGTAAADKIAAVFDVLNSGDFLRY